MNTHDNFPNEASCSGRCVPNTDARDAVLASILVFCQQSSVQKHTSPCLAISVCLFLHFLLLSIFFLLFLFSFLFLFVFLFPIPLLSLSHVHTHSVSPSFSLPGLFLSLCLSSFFLSSFFLSLSILFSFFAVVHLCLEACTHLATLARKHAVMKPGRFVSTHPAQDMAVDSKLPWKQKEWFFHWQQTPLLPIPPSLLRLCVFCRFSVENHWKKIKEENATFHSVFQFCSVVRKFQAAGQQSSSSTSFWGDTISADPVLRCHRHFWNNGDQGWIFSNLQSKGINKGNMTHERAALLTEVRTNVRNVPHFGSPTASLLSASEVSLSVSLSCGSTNHSLWIHRKREIAAFVKNFLPETLLQFSLSFNRVFFGGGAMRL